MTTTPLRMYWRAEFRQVAVLAAASICAFRTLAAGPSAGPWFERALVGLEIAPTGAQFGIEPGQPGYAVNYDAREVVRRSKEVGSDYTIVTARDADYTYYDSKLQPKAPTLGKRDPLRDAVDESRKVGLPIIAYDELQYCTDTLRQHPEWRMVGCDGRPLAERVCFRSGYLDYMKKLLAEQLAYGVDGFLLDMVDQGFIPPYGCWCSSCEREYQAQYHRPMPRHATWDEDWDRLLELRYASSAQFEKELTRFVHSISSRTAVFFNYHGTPPFSWQAGQRPVQHAVNADFVSGETGIWGFGALNIGLNPEFYRSATPARPYNVAMQRGAHWYFDQTSRPLDDLRWELFDLLAHGAFVTVVDTTAFDGKLDPEAYERYRALLGEAHRKRTHFGQPPVREVGIYFSCRTRDWLGREEPGDFFRTFQGAHKALVYEHIPWGIIQEENVTLETLRQFPVVLLPNVAILSEREAGLLRAYVETGGELIVTGLSGTMDRFGHTHAESSLTDLIGARLKTKLESQDNWVSLPAGTPGPLGSLRGDIRPDWPFLVEGAAVVYEPTTAGTVGDLFKPLRTLRQLNGKEQSDLPLSPAERVGPAILLNRVGQGAVLTFAASPDFACASDYYMAETHKLLSRAVRLLDPKPLVEISAPVTVEAVVTDEPAARTLRVHLIGYNSPPQATPADGRPNVTPALIEDAPMFQATIKVNRLVRRAAAFDHATVLSRSGNRLDLTVHNIHEVIMIRY